MHKEDVSCTMFAFVTGATVGAGIGLLFAPQSGSQLRASLRECMSKATKEDNQATDEGTESGATRSHEKSEGIRMPGAECSVRSGPQDHTVGDTGHDN